MAQRWLASFRVDLVVQLDQPRFHMISSVKVASDGILSQMLCEVLTTDLAWEQARQRFYQTLEGMLGIA